MNLSEQKRKALQLIQDAGGILNYQRSINGFGAQGCDQNDRIVMQKAHQLIRLGVIEVSRFIVDRRGNVHIDQIKLKQK